MKGEFLVTEAPLLFDYDDSRDLLGGRTEAGNLRVLRPD